MNGFQYILYPLFWALGLKYLYLYGVFALYARRTMGDIYLFAKDQRFFFVLLVAFFLYQILSTFIGLFISEIPMLRFVGIFHNYFIYLIFVAFCAVTYVRGVDIPVYVTFIAGFCGLVYVFAQYFGFEVLWRGVVDTVIFVDKGYLDEGSIARLSVFSDYYNATAILAFGVFYLLMKKILDADFKAVFFVYIVFFVVLLGTGSRLAVLLYLTVAPVLLLRNLSLILLVYLFSLLFLLLFGYELYLYFDSLREDSSDTRSFIYQYSISYVNGVNPYTGLGFKPKFDWMKYPVGSHSSFVGYYTKNGFIGLLFWLFICMYLIFYALKNFVIAPPARRREAFFEFMMIFNLLLFFGFEDMDAFELNGVYFGVLVGGIFRSRREYEVKY